MTKIRVVCLFARQLGLDTLKGALNDPLFDVVCVVTHYHESKEFEKYVNLCKPYVPLIVTDKKQKALKLLKCLTFDFLVANCYKYLIPSDILELAKVESLNMHRSLLPRYKGINPIKRALENNETKTGTTIHRMTAVFDCGNIIDQYNVSIEKGDTVSDVFEKLYPIQYPLFKRSLLKLKSKFCMMK